MAFELTQQLEIEVTVVDIAFDDTLFERYGVTIPVLNFQGNELELHWPFDSSQLQIWLFNNGITYHK